MDAMEDSGPQTRRHPERDESLKERRYTRENHYQGSVEVWVDGSRHIEAQVRLTKRERMDEIQTLAGTETVALQTIWEGRFRGLTQEQLRPLQVSDGGFELRLPDGSVGLAVLPNDRDLAYLQGLGDPPF